MFSYKLISTKEKILEQANELMDYQIKKEIFYEYCKKHKNLRYIGYYPLDTNIITLFEEGKLNIEDICGFFKELGTEK